MKIGYRFASLYFVITLIILLIFSLSVYFGMQRILLNTLDENLRFVVDSVEENYDPATDKFEYMDKEPEEADPFLEYYVVIYDVSGRPIYKSAIAQKVSLKLPLSDRQTTRGRTTRITVKEAVQWVHPDRGGEITFRAFNRKIYYKDRQIGWVTIARPIEGIDESLNKLAFVFSIAILGTVILIALGSYFMTKRVLFPIDIITRKANQISHENLNERIRNVRSNDELGALAATLNGLLDRLQNAFESRRQFMADAAHELKTPLAVLRAHWEEELNNPVLSMVIKEKLTHDIETLSRMNHLINNLLLLSQTENLQSNFTFHPVRLDSIIQEVALDASVLSDLKSQTLRTEQLPEVTIQGDRERLYQLFFNILENAIKYTPENGEIRILAERKDETVEVTIQDSGPGIPAKDLPYIFDRFYRVKKDRSRRTGGSGLGLSIARLIAKAHGGRITAESKTGVGSVFKIKLPVTA
ncbi:signal transduction histidine-protein kinase BaeS [bacterium BMS3Abin05]|nr:signal transduction histidine-protein kinase BaeS [bacterium BMS3Abin05]GBE27156.1 signal transduction histidine-protein kinase BaeS [bacterium BMS3Bbin03]HDZ13156.1 sensor histidine kinase [Bacteroidota bacterium]